MAPKHPSVVTARRPVGNYALQSAKEAVLKPNNPLRISKQQLQLKAVAGLTIRLNRQWIHPGSRWDWSFPDSCIDLCQTVNKPFKLLLQSDGETDQPWHKSRIDRYSELYNRMGERYRDHPLLTGVHTGTITRASTSEELHPEQNWPTSADQKLVDAFDQITQVISSAFPFCSLWTAGSVKYGAKRYMDDIITVGLRNAPGRFGFKHNALRGDKPGTERADHNQMVIDAALRGTLMGWEMVQPVSYDINKAIKFARGMATLAGYNPNQIYVDVYPGNLSGLRLVA